MVDIGLTHVALPVLDLERSLAFYATYTDLRVVHRRGSEAGSRVAWIGDGTRPFVVVLIETPEVAAPLRPLGHLGVGCATPQRLLELCALARARGELVSEPRDDGPPVGLWAFLADPDGHTLELSHGQEIGRSQGLDPRLHWLAEPPRWEWDAASGGLRVWPAGRTDFWQRTHYGFEADNGHALLMEAAGDVVFTTRVTAHPRHRYDQAGLLLRLSPACWIKTSVEFEPDGPNRLGAVVTNAQASDWSTQPLDRDIMTVWFRLRREGRDVIADSSLDGEHWEQLRMARLQELSETGPVLIGLYACSPTAAGFMAEFDQFGCRSGQVG